MNKTEFVDLLSKELGQSQVKTSHIMNSVLKLIVEVMKENDELKIVGFGTFKAKNYPSVI
ncbi:HU family DNA-binding protein, partial [Candidatus Cyrtobacter comes]|uniref:HU family DNA-binding protein n=1 Tax=Candidatus Cyrtobacter comes TaxID=675776 RepID=UPI003977A43A